MLQKSKVKESLVKDSVECFRKGSYTCGKHAKAPPFLGSENRELDGGCRAQGAEEEATSTADKQLLKCGSAEDFRGGKHIFKDLFENAACSQESDAELKSPRDVCVVTKHWLTIDAPVARTPRGGEEQQDAPQRGNPSKETVAVAAPPVETRGTTILGRAAERLFEERATRSGDEGAGERKRRLLQVNVHLQSERSKPHEFTGFEHGKGEVESYRVRAAMVQDTPATFLPDVPPARSGETERVATGEATICTKMPGSLSTESGDARVAVAPEESKGWESRESQEECLRRVLCELDRQALECMQQRMQRSVGFLLETRKEKEAEQLALLRERRRLDAMLADAQKQLTQYSTSKSARTGGAVGALSLIESRNHSATSGFVCLEPSTLSSSSTMVTAPASQLQLPGRERNVCEETVSADAECAATSLRLHPLSPLQGGSNDTELVLCSKIQETTYPVDGLKKSEEDGYESVLADFLGDLLHKYGPAAVKGVGAAAHIVKEGLGVLRQELHDLQQHQQATERQRAMEKRARIMIQREERLERLRHQHLMHQLQYHHVLAGGNGRPPHKSSNARTAAATPGSADARNVATPVGLLAPCGAASPAQEIQHHDGGNNTSSLATTSAASSTSFRSPRECTTTAAGGRSPSSRKKVMLPEACIRATDKFRHDALETKGCESEKLHLCAKNPQEMCEGSTMQDEQLQKRESKAVTSIQPPTHIPEIAAVHVAPNLMITSPPAGDDQHKGADPNTKEHAQRNSGQVCTSASAKAAASWSWTEFFAVEGKSSPPSHQLVEDGFKVKKNNKEAVALMNGSTCSATNASNSLQCDRHSGSVHSQLPSSRGSIYVSARPVPLVSSGLPPPCKTLGTRKERLQRTAASLNSISRGVADAVGSVGHTIARWFYISGESSTASIDRRALVQENVISDSGNASASKEKKLLRAEPSALDVRGVQHVRNPPCVSVGSDAAGGTTTVAERSRQQSQVDLSASGEKGDLSGVASASPLETVSESEAIPRNSNVSSVTAEVADGDVADGVLGIVDGTASVTDAGVCCTKAVVQRYCVEGVPQTKDKVRQSEDGDDTSRLTTVIRKSSAADHGSDDEVFTASKPSSGERQRSAAVRVTCATGSVVTRDQGPASAVAKNVQPAGHSNDLSCLDPNGGAKKPPVPTDGQNARSFQNSGRGFEEERASGPECSANEEDPPVIEASIRVGGKNGTVTLPLVVLATEQCRDVAEEWVDRHWAHLQQSHFWLMRGRNGASEAAAEVGPISNGSRDGNASRKRNGEMQSSGVEHEEKGRAGRHVCGNGAAKTTFLTRSRAIHSLAAFLGHAEASSENLPVRVVADWENIIVSPSAGITRELRQRMPQKNYVENGLQA